MPPNKNVALSNPPSKPPKEKQKSISSYEVPTKKVLKSKTLSFQDDEFDDSLTPPVEEKDNQDAKCGNQGTNNDAKGYVTVYILAYNSKMEKYAPSDVVHTATVFVPKTAQLNDFDIIIGKTIQERFPRYSGGYECRCLKQDVVRSALIITAMVSKKKLTPEEVTPGVILPLVGRVFVVLHAPHDLPSSSGNCGGGGGHEVREGGEKPAGPGRSPLMDLTVNRSRAWQPPWSHEPPCPPPKNFYLLKPPPAKRRKLAKANVIHSQVQDDDVVNEQQRPSAKRVPVLQKSATDTRKRKHDEDSSNEQLIQWLNTSAMSIRESVQYILQELIQMPLSRPVLKASRRLTSVHANVMSAHSSHLPSSSHHPSCT